jgi:3-methyladenine DNA glycosylase AlkD
MADECSAAQFMQRLEAERSAEQLDKLKHLKADASDIIWGVRMGTIFELAKAFITMPLEEIEKLLDSPIHEARVGALSILDKQARRKKITPAERQELYEFYLRRHDRINQWDLVDLAAPHVIGGYLIDKPRDLLYRLARSENVWERRTAIVATGYFIRQGDTTDAFQIAEILVQDPNDYIHKAVGWMLREAGKQDRPALLAFLDRHAAHMPRTMLRYAIEHLGPEKRIHYLDRKTAP